MRRKSKEQVSFTKSNHIHDPLSSAPKFLKIFAKSIFNNPESTQKTHTGKYSKIQGTKVAKFASA